MGLIVRFKTSESEVLPYLFNNTQYTKYKHPKDVLSGLSALIECGIIVRSDSHFKYFINPLMVFNGDRVSFAKTYIKKKKEAGKAQLDLFALKELAPGDLTEHIQ